MGQQREVMRTHLLRSRWAAIGAAIAVSSLGGGSILAASASGETNSSTTFISIVPTRVLDTREASSPIHTLGPNGHATLSLASYVPVDATGVSMNVTVVNGTAPSFLTIYPTGMERPTASNLNWADSAAHP